MAVTVAGFRTRYPEFKFCQDEFLQAYLDDASLSISEELWGTTFEQGVYCLAARRLALSPFGNTAKLSKADGTTTYDTQYNELLMMVAPMGYRVI